MRLVSLPVENRDYHEGIVAQNVENCVGKTAHENAVDFGPTSHQTTRVWAAQSAGRSLTDFLGQLLSEARFLAFIPSNGFDDVRLHFYTDATGSSSSGLAGTSSSGAASIATMA